jgi:hypothetical protein
MEVEIRRRNNLSVVARQCYDRYEECKRRDGSIMFINSSAVICVLSKACMDGEIPCIREKNRRVYLLLEDAKGYLDEYIAARAYGKGREYLLDPYKNELPVYSRRREKPKEEKPEVDPVDWEFGWLARKLGINRVYDALLQIRLSVDELVKVWKS